MTHIQLNGTEPILATDLLATTTISRATLYKRLSNGKLLGKKVGKRWYCSPAQFERNRRILDRLTSDPRYQHRQELGRRTGGMVKREEQLMLPFAAEPPLTSCDAQALVAACTTLVDRQAAVLDKLDALLAAFTTYVR